MPLQLPYGTLDEIIKMRANRPQPLAALANGLTSGAAEVGSAYYQKKGLDKQQDHQVLQDIFKNYELRPSDPNQPAQGVTFGDLFKAQRGGKVPEGVPPPLLNFTAVPKTDMTALARIIPSLLQNQPPGKTTPLQGPGGILQTGTLPEVSPTATVTPQPKGGRGGTSTISEQDRQAFQALSNTVKELGQQPISPKDYDKRWLETFTKNAKAVGMADDEIQRRVKSAQPKLKEFATNLQKGLEQIKKNKKVSPQVRQWLLQTYPAQKAEILKAIPDA